MKKKKMEWGTVWVSDCCGKEFHSKAKCLEHEDINNRVRDHDCYVRGVNRILSFYFTKYLEEATEEIEKKREVNKIVEEEKGVGRVVTKVAKAIVQMTNRSCHTRNSHCG